MRRRAGMTLIELIVVMALLSIMFAMAAPKMSSFFRGRALKEETRRFIALTRLARSEAASRAVPMELWLDPEYGAYGLRATIEYESETNPPFEYALSNGLWLDLGDAELDNTGLALITFAPDGAVGEESLSSFFIFQEDGRAMEIKQAGYGLGYYAEVPSDDTLYR